MSNGKLKKGQQFDPRDLLGPIQFTEQMMDDVNAESLLGSAATEIIPNDAQSSKVTTYDVAAVMEEIETFYLSYDDFTSFQLPPTLISLAVSSVKKDGMGDSVTDPGDAAATGTSGSVDLTINNSAQASAAVSLALVPIIRQNIAENVPVTRYFFYMPPGNVSQVDVITKLQGLTALTILPWPRFRPRSDTVVLRYGQVSVNQTARSHAGARFSSGSSSYEYYPKPGERSDGNSVDVALTSETVTLPFTLHGVITPTFTAETITATVTVKADVPSITDLGGTPVIDAIENHPTPLSSSFTTSITPTSLTATSPSDIPTSGYYLKSINPSADKYGLTVVQCEVVNFAYFA